MSSDVEMRILALAPTLTPYTIAVLTEKATEVLVRMCTLALRQAVAKHKVRASALDAATDIVGRIPFLAPFSTPLVSTYILHIHPPGSSFHWSWLP